MAAADRTETERQAEVPGTSNAADEADSIASGMLSQSRSGTRQAALATSTGLQDAGADVTGVLHGARVAADSVETLDKPAPAAAVPQAHVQRPSDVAAPVMPAESGRMQLTSQQELGTQGKLGQNSDADDVLTREHHTLLAPEADAEGSKRASEHNHAEL